jgi:heme-degrading monooxygenase HmoA
MKIESLDPTTQLPAQLKEKTGQITLVNVFNVPPDQVDDFLSSWQEDAAIMKNSPGFVSTQLYRGTAGSQLLVNVAVWESTEALAAAFNSPEFQAAREKSPEGVIAHPHIFEKIAVPGICDA